MKWNAVTCIPAWTTNVAILRFEQHDTLLTESTPFCRISCLKLNIQCYEVFTWPPVSGKPKTFAWPKYPCTDKMTTSNTIGILPRNVSNVEGSGAWRMSERRCIISETFPAVSPQPLSKPIPCNLHMPTTMKWHKKISQVQEHLYYTTDIYTKLTHIQIQYKACLVVF